MEKMMSSGVQRVAMTLVLGSCIVACDGRTELAAPTPAAADALPPARQLGSVHIYWTAVDESGKTAIREDVITAEQRDALMAARKANAKKGRARGEGPREGHAMATIGSQSWSDCQYYDWLLFTSGFDDSGSIFCATTDGQNTSPQVIQMPFAPAWWDASWYHSALVCWTAVCHHQPSYCGDKSAVSVWGYFPQTNGGNNLNLVEGVRYIAVDPPTSCP